MDYQNTLTYLYNSVPMFQQVGGSAYKEGLENTRILDEHFGHPPPFVPHNPRGRNQRQRLLFPYIGCHIAGGGIPRGALHLSPTWWISANASV